MVWHNPISHFGHRIAAYDVTTLYPLALFISIANIADDEKAAMYNDLVSYVVRRSVCGLTPKNYNNVFMNVLRHLSKTEISSVELRNILNSLNGEASRWPRDSEFQRLHQCSTLSGRLDAPKMRSMLTELERELCRQVKTEKPDVPNLSNLDIDHLMPQSWYSCWPLENGHMVTNSDATVMNQIVLSGTDLTPEQLLVRKRQQAIATLGNLTLLNLSVNRSVQNAVFLKKRDALIVHTNLRLNIPLILKDKWDESEILERGKSWGNCIESMAKIRLMQLIK